MFIFIDTAVKGCNIALADENGIIGYHQEPIERGHAEHIIPIFEKLLSDHTRKSEDIHKVYVTVGPGSFTGLRVGLTVAQFIGFTLKISVEGITSFQAFSCNVDKGEERAVLVETKRSDYYLQILDENHNPLNEPLSLPANDVQKLLSTYPDIILTGDAVDRFANETDLENQSIQQDMIDIESVTKALCDGQLKTVKAEAFYIRGADVSQPKKRVV
jgi:tRNA threonylcarbamoyladenosine biosynthesis protein TsaB